MLSWAHKKIIKTIACHIVAIGCRSEPDVSANLRYVWLVHELIFVY